MDAVASEVIASASGEPWAAFVRDRLFTPLGMRRSTTSVAELASRTNVASPHARRFFGRLGPVRPRKDLDIDNIGLAGPTEARPDGSRIHRVDLTGDGTPDFAFVDPGFTRWHLRSNSVLRWEYRPGSSLFLVWSQNRSRFDPDGSLRLIRDAGELFGAPGTNVLLLKVSHWFGL
jgi:CubicO group peptidase (beta-lactamase class C family)